MHDRYAELEANVDNVMERGIAEGQFPGGVVLVRHQGEVILRKAYGHSMKYKAHGVPAEAPIEATVDTIYDLASITKLFTATCMMQLVEEGKVGLDSPVAEYLPEFASEGKADRTVRQLLTHVAGLKPFEHLWELAPTAEARRMYTLRTVPQADVDEAYVYSDIGLITLGILVEQVDGRDLARSVSERVLQPLGLERTGYRPLERFLREEIAATEDESDTGRGLVWGEVHDENAWSLGGAAGHAGLFGTAEDVSIFAQTYLSGGMYNGTRLLGPETVSEMTRNQIGGLGSRGLGWQLDAEFYMGRFSSPETYGHTGFTGTSVFVHPASETVVVLLTNRVHTTRNGPLTTPSRRGVADAVYDAVMLPANAES